MLDSIALRFRTPLNSGNVGEGKAGTVSYFWGMDTESLYKSNLEKLPTDWIYRNKQIKYTTNSAGYRAQEWYKLDWANSILVLGCSFVFGDGVDDTETIPFYMEKILGIPTINLGAGGASQLWLLHNSTILYENYPCPKAIVFVWPDQSRVLRYNNFQPARESVWNGNQLNSYFEQYNRNRNPEAMAYFNRLLAKNLWKDRCIFYDISFNDDVSMITGCDYWPLEARNPNNDISLAARDGKHLNHIANQIVAEQISKNLQGQGL